MLADKSFFDRIEAILRSDGTLDSFEKERGKITTRMMIVSSDIPEKIQAEYKGEGNLRGYVATFDFTDVSLRLIMDMDTKRIVGNVWAFADHDIKERPEKFYTEIFIKKITQYVDENDMEDAPICTFISDEGDITVTLTKSDLENAEKQN